MFHHKMFNIKFLRRPEDVQEKPEIQFLLEKCHPWESYEGAKCLGQYRKTFFWWWKQENEGR